MVGQEVLYPPRPVGLQTVPDNDQGCSELTVKLAEKFQRPQGVDIGIAVQAKVQMNPVTLRRHAQGADDGDLLMRSGTLIDHRGVAPRRPTAAHQRRHQQARFVDKDQPGSQACGVFFTRGQSFFTQFAIAFSSRSTARRVGFCGLHPIARNNRPT